MATIERPSFYEGQILSADDLQQSLNYNRDQQARHARVSHSWGIAGGLNVEVADGALEIQPGMAIDSSGASVIVSEPVVIDDAFLRRQLVGPKSGVYPLFIRGQQQAATSRRLVGQCNGGGATRMQEGVVVEFDEESRLLDWDQQVAPAFDGGPDDQQAGRRILLGFAAFDAGAGEFEDFFVVYAVQDRVFRPRYVHAVADGIVSVSGRINVRTHPRGAADAPMLTIDPENEDATFAFGVDDGEGETKQQPLVTIDKKGNLTALGAVKGTATSGDVVVRSGLATHGTTVPLPPGIQAGDVESGGVALHPILTPRHDLCERPAGLFIDVPLVQECYLDDQRRVHCLVAWVGVGVLVAPGVCEYTLIATVADEGGSGS